MFSRMRKIFPKFLAITLMGTLGAAPPVLGTSFSKGGKEKEQILYRSNGGDPASLDPHKSVGIPDYTLTADLFEGLVAFNDKGEIVPGVAYKWSVSSDGLTWIFHLRKEAYWSNGDPVTAQDFVYSFRRFVNPNTRGRSTAQLSVLKNAYPILKGELKDLTQLGVKALDEYTLEIHLENPAPYLLDILAYGRGFPVHRESAEKYGDLWARPDKMISNGPFILKEWKVGDYIRISKNPFYWNRNKVVLKEVYFLSIPDESVELNLFRTGKIHVSHYNLQSSPSLEFIREKAPQVLRISLGLKMASYGINFHRPAFQDKRIREALNLVINRDLITRKFLFSGEALPAYGFQIPGLKNQIKSQFRCQKMSMEQRFERARYLYREAGYSSEKPLKITLMVPNKPSRLKVAVAVADMIHKALGAEVTLEKKEFKVYISHLGQNTYDLYDLSWSLGYNDIWDILGNFSYVYGGVNLLHYANPAFDALLEKSHKTGNVEERDALLDEACQILCDDEALIPLFYHSHIRLVQPQVQGFFENPRGVHPSCYMSLAADQDPIIF